MQESIAKRAPALTPVLRNTFTAYLPVWTVSHEDLRSTHRMAIVFEPWLQEWLRTCAQAKNEGTQFWTFRCEWRLPKIRHLFIFVSPP